MEQTRGITIVLGNGFDLACGMKSRFADYLQYVCKHNRGYASYVDFCGKAIQKYDFPSGYDILNYDIASKTKGVNLWLLVLGAISGYFRADHLLWSDVEEAVHDVIYAHLGNETKYGVFDPRTIARRAEAYTESPDYDPHLASSLLGLASALSNFGEDVFQKEDQVAAHKFMLAQLHKFEHGFRDYLRHARSKCEGYEKKAVSLYHCLCTLNGESGAKGNVVSFNYIPFVAQDFAFLTPGKDIGYVHGQLDGSILIGVMPSFMEEEDVENKEYDPFDSTYWFSKEYRRFDLLGEKKNNIRMPGIESDIVFFGLSLSSQDYHTIFRIFDALLDVDQPRLAGIPALSGKTLTFAYYVYDMGRAEDIKTRLFQSVKRALIAWNKLRKLHWPNVIDDLIDLGALSIREIKKNKNGEFYPA